MRYTKHIRRPHSSIEDGCPRHRTCTDRDLKSLKMLGYAIASVRQELASRRRNVGSAARRGLAQPPDR